MRAHRPPNPPPGPPPVNELILTLLLVVVPLRAEDVPVTTVWPSLRPLVIWTMEVVTTPTSTATLVVVPSAFTSWTV
jgi:hypothetical protein